jgi:DNA-binding HxlR family transcriptional regulator
LRKNDEGRLIVSHVEPMKQVETEQQLEEIIVENPHFLMPGLKLVGRQTPTPGGPLDLLGVDEDGNLVVFELKRGKLSREAVAQVLDYASFLYDLDVERLCKHISERSGTGGIDKIEDFENWYQENFPTNPEGYTGNPRLVLVGLQVDETTHRMVNFLAEGGLDISLITFHAFKNDGGQFLARQVEVHSENPPGPGYSKTENLKALMSLAEKTGVSELLQNMASFLRDELPSAYEHTGKTGYSYTLPELTEKGNPTLRVYTSMYIWENKPRQIELVFQNRAVATAREAFDKLLSQNGDRFREEHENLRTWVKPGEDWEGLSMSLKSVFPEILSGWRAKTEEEQNSPPS